MSYSDLLARQEKELELLNQSYYVDQATVKQLRNDHYDQSRFDGQLQRLQELHERQVKETQARFAQEQRDYLGEPAPPALLPDISQSQDKAIDMIKLIGNSNLKVVQQANRIQLVVSRQNNLKL